MGLPEPIILKKNSLQSLDQTGRKIRAEKSGPKNPGRKIRAERSMAESSLYRFYIMG